MYKPLLVRPLGPTTPGDLWTDTITMVWDVPPWSAFTKVGKSCLLTRFVQVLLNRGDWRKGRVDSDVPVTDFIKVDLKKERSRDSKMNHVFFCSKVFFQMLHYTLNSVCGVFLCLFMDLHFESCREIETMDVTEASILGCGCTWFTRVVRWACIIIIIIIIRESTYISWLYQGVESYIEIQVQLYHHWTRPSYNVKKTWYMIYNLSWTVRKTRVPT